VLRTRPAGRLGCATPGLQPYSAGPRHLYYAVGQRASPSCLEKSATVNDNPFLKAYDQLPSAISTLPPGYLNGNAAALLGIVDELAKSNRLELKVIQAIKNVDIANAAAVHDLASQIEEYYLQRGFDRERTHCHNIDRIVRALLVPPRGGTQAELDRVAQVEQLLAPLRVADNDFIGDLEPLVQRAQAAITGIDAHLRGADSRAAMHVQQTFVTEYTAHVERLKERLKQMNQLANDLIDRL